MTNPFDFYINSIYAHTYAVVNYTKGEVYTFSSNDERIALKTMLKRFYSVLRTAKLFGKECKIALVNANEGKVLLSGEYEVPEYVWMFGCKTEAEYEAKINELYDMIGE
jgi:hypothetical protein